MGNILTAAEAANVLRCEVNDPLMTDLLPAVDAYIELSTGRDWASDSSIYPEAKAAARILLVQWHEDPGMMGVGPSVLSGGLQACLAQLEAKALELETLGIPDEALKIVTSMPKDGADDIAITASIVLVFNHDMASGSTSTVTLKTAAGASVTVTNSLDATTRILTVNPDASLVSGTMYKVSLVDTPDIYGMTLTEDLYFTTA